ncbi:hypothetical protein OHC33_011260 [Knufia fluminis]|uniref:Uncharacterized protein n=1 Tax=Knufia fluminis TaxID=191047 RepID=A0AAN8IH53_9EURO|nr:hypothetical protein OHC33_011260 [Knufia fluminis]
MTNDAATVVDILKSVRTVLQSDKELRKNVPLTISMKNQGNEKSYQGLLQYEGPEDETVTELAINHQWWSVHPASFWQAQLAPDLSHLGPEAQIVGCYMLRDRSDK